MGSMTTYRAHLNSFQSNFRICEFVWAAFVEGRSDQFVPDQRGIPDLLRHTGRRWRFDSSLRPQICAISAYGNHEDCGSGRPASAQVWALQLISELEFNLEVSLLDWL